ncbi:hypothetical protein ACFE04_031645 [Oxalis oulophora]
MAYECGFSDEDLAVDEHLGYPKAYAKIARDRGFSPFNAGPPFTFTCYTLQDHEETRAEQLDRLFPILDSNAKSTGKPKIYLSLLWKQLNHLGNAGFDPAVIRVDPYGNVLYFHADSSSPLAWDFDHWFPCSRGGLTLPSNLRILQWQVCKRRHNKLEFLVPWWDLQLGISVNQFLSIFASANSDFRQRGFSFLFAEGGNEEINDSQTVESHQFPNHFIESMAQFGLAPAAIVECIRRESYDRPFRPQTPALGARKMKPLKESDGIDFATNPYQAIVMARDSLKQKEETQKILAEIQKQDEEAHELRKKNDEEKLAIQELEMELIKRRRRVEKCRRLAESQSSYRVMLEKMIRDAMHQSVIYKEQVRLNQAASNALMARLEAQKAMCDASEKDLHIKFRQRNELDKQIRPEWDQARKRSRLEDDDTLIEDRDSKSVLYLPQSRPKTSLHKELRVFLEEEQRASQADFCLNDDLRHDEIEKIEEPANCEKSIEQKFQDLDIKEENSALKLRFSNRVDSEKEEDEESRKQRGKGNVERWLQLLLENNTPEELNLENETNKNEEIFEKRNLVYPQKETDGEKPEQTVDENTTAKKEKEKTEIEESNILKEKTNVITPGDGNGRSMRVERTPARKVERSESARIFRRIPSSPSLILGMKKGVDCLRKKPMVNDDDEFCNENENHHQPFANRLKSSPFRTIRKAVKL